MTTPVSTFVIIVLAAGQEVPAAAIMNGFFIITRRIVRSPKKMAEAWIKPIENALEAIRKLKTPRDVDRLKLVKLLRLILFILNGSVDRWVLWSTNYDIATKFSVTELAEVVERLTKIANSWLENDLDTLKKLAKKGEKERKLERKPHVV